MSTSKPVKPKSFQEPNSCLSSSGNSAPSEQTDLEISGSAFPLLQGFLEVLWNERTQKIVTTRWVRESRFTQKPQLSVAPPERLVFWIAALRDLLEVGRPLPQLDWSCFDLDQCTDFQKQVFKAISKIPHGETRTYGWVASCLAKPAASRAVGQALRSNPLMIFIPCHRVVSVVSLGGFLGFQCPNEPEVQLKKRLLEIETEYLSPVFSFLKTDARQEQFCF